MVHKKNFKYIAPGLFSVQFYTKTAVVNGLVQF